MLKLDVASVTIFATNFSWWKQIHSESDAGGRQRTDECQSSRALFFIPKRIAYTATIRNGEYNTDEYNTDAV